MAFFASSPGLDSEKDFLCYYLLSYPVSVRGSQGEGSRTHPLLLASLLWRCKCILGRASAGLCPGVVSSLDVAHSLIQLEFCLFARGRHKEIRGVRERERVREELSSHIWVDGTHGESTLEWSAVSPHFSCILSPVPQLFLIYSSKIHLPSIPLSTSIPPLPLFIISTFYFYPIRAPYTLSSLLPLRPKRSQMLQCERQSRSVIFFQPLLQEVGPFWKKGKRNEGRES